MLPYTKQEHFVCHACNSTCFGILASSGKKRGENTNKINKNNIKRQKSTN